MHFRDIPNLGLWYTDFLTGETAWSNEMFVIYGLKPVSSMPSVEILMKYTHPEDRDMVSNGIHLATKTLRPFSFYYRIIRKDNAQRDLFSAGAFELNPDGKPIGRYGICLNLTGLNGEQKGKMRQRLNGVVVPARIVLYNLDLSNASVASLCDGASIVSEQQHSRIAKGRSTI